MGGGPISPTSPQAMPSKKTSPHSSDPKTKPTANIDQVTCLQTYFLLSTFAIASIIFILLAVRILPFDVSTDPEFEIHSISVAYPFDDRNRATNFLYISLTSINPNKDGEIIYENLFFSVFREKELFLVGILPPFKQEAGETKLVEETVGVFSGSVDNTAVLGGGNYSVEIDGRIKYAPGTFWERNAKVTVRCDDVRVEFPPPEDARVESPPPDSEVETTVTEEFPGEVEHGWVEQVVWGLCLLGFWLTPYLCFWFITRLVWPLICCFGRLLF